MKNLNIIGIGMGNLNTMTIAAENTIKKADLIIGASRIVNEVCQKYHKEGIALIKADDIVSAVEETNKENIAVIMSGDTGFYSGGKRLGKALDEKGYKYTVIPGISSLSYFAGKLNISWNDIKAVSLHGRTEDPLKYAINYEKTFFLLGNNMPAKEVCRILKENNLGKVSVTIGENLSYENEKIIKGAAEDFINSDFDNLSVMLVENPKANLRKDFSYRGISDYEFIRGNIPMTKSEVRAISISKLAPEKEDIIWDIGAGTGSVTVELAMAAKYGKVLAFECKEEATDLIKVNAEKFGLENIKVYKGVAPEILEEEKCLPAPDKVFIGGNRGNLREIFKEIFKRNPEALVVINAVTMETVAEAFSLIKEFNLKDIDICQVTVAKTKRVASYNMFQGASPVFIIKGRG